MAAGKRVFVLSQPWSQDESELLDIHLATPGPCVPSTTFLTTLAPELEADRFAVDSLGRRAAFVVSAGEVSQIMHVDLAGALASPVLPAAVDAVSPMIAFSPSGELTFAYRLPGRPFEFASTDQSNSALTRWWTIAPTSLGFPLQH